MYSSVNVETFQWNVIVFMKMDFKKNKMESFDTKFLHCLMLTCLYKRKQIRHIPRAILIHKHSSNPTYLRKYFAKGLLKFVAVPRPGSQVVEIKKLAPRRSEVPLGSLYNKAVLCAQKLSLRLRLDRLGSCPTSLWRA